MSSEEGCIVDGEFIPFSVVDAGEESLNVDETDLNEPDEEDDEWEPVD